MNSFYANAGQRIRRLRESKRYTREELAEIAEISSKFLYEIETGHKGFSADTLYRISKALSVTSDYILSGNNQLTPINELTNALCLFEDTHIEKMIHILEILNEFNRN